MHLYTVIIFHNLYIYFALSVCLSVRLYPIDVKTAEPGKVSEYSKFQKLAFNKIQFPLKFENPRNAFNKSANFFVCFCFTMFTKRKCSQLK